MRTALGLDVDAVSSFAAVISLDSSGTDSGSDSGTASAPSSARPRELPLKASPAPAALAGETLIADDQVVAAVHTAVAAATTRGGEAPTAIVVSHPLAWDARRIERVRRALFAADLNDVNLIDSARAAAVAADMRRSVERGSVVIVVALRSGGAEVRALRKDGDLSFHSVAAPISVAGVDESELDAALLSIVVDRLEGGLPDDVENPAVASALERVRLAVHQARERLCLEETTFVGVRLPGRATVVEETRSDFEAAVEAAVGETVPALVEAIGAAAGGVAAHEIVITGSASPTPLLAELLRAQLETPIMLSGRRLDNAYGAALVAAAIAAEKVTEPSVLPVPEVVLPEIVLPEIVLTEAVLPETVLPETVLPETALPEAVLPETALVDAAMAVEEVEVAEVATSPDAVQRRRKPVTILQLWPIAAAAAALVVLGGAAAVSGVTLTPTGTDHATGPGSSTSDGSEGTSSGSSSSSGGASSAAPGSASDSSNGGGRSPSDRRSASAKPGSTTAPGTTSTPGSSSGPSGSATPTDPGTTPPATSPSPAPTIPDPLPTIPDPVPTIPDPVPTIPDPAPSTTDSSAPDPAAS
jgi:hypothetical protein